MYDLGHHSPPPTLWLSHYLFATLSAEDAADRLWLRHTLKLYIAGIVNIRASELEGRCFFSTRWVDAQRLALVTGEHLAKYFNA